METVKESRELMPVPADVQQGQGGGSLTLFGTNDPDAVIDRATKVARTLARVLEQSKLYAPIGDGKYIEYEGWCTLGAMLGVFPINVSTRRVENGWEARCEARTKDGAVIGAADSQCLRDEENWTNKPDFQLRSMAQTRAGSKALASALRFIPVLAGFKGTPAEEMTAGNRKPAADAPKLGAGESIRVSVLDVSVKTGSKDGKKWTLFGIKVTTDGGSEMWLNTFDTTFADVAKSAKEKDQDVLVAYDARDYKGQKKYDLTSIQPFEDQKEAGKDKDGQ